jgi:hypothetical protein
VLQVEGGLVQMGKMLPLVLVVKVVTEQTQLVDFHLRLSGEVRIPQ